MDDDDLFELTGMRLEDGDGVKVTIEEDEEERPPAEASPPTAAIAGGDASTSSTSPGSSSTVAAASSGKGSGFQTSSINRTRRDVVFDHIRPRRPEKILEQQPQTTGVVEFGLLLRLERACIESDEKLAASTVSALEEGFRQTMKTPAVAAAAARACKSCLAVVKGRYSEVLDSTSLLPATTAAAVAAAAAAPASHGSSADEPTRRGGYSLRQMRDHIVSYISVDDEDDEMNDDGPGGGGGGDRVSCAMWRSMEACMVGAAALNIFLQQNFTGPELPKEQVRRVNRALGEALGLIPVAVPPPPPTSSSSSSSSAADRGKGGDGQGDADEDTDTDKDRLISSEATLLLSVDGELPYNASEVPVALLAARIIFSALSLSCLSPGARGRNDNMWDEPAAIEEEPAAVVAAAVVSPTTVPGGAAVPVPPPVSVPPASSAGGSASGLLPFGCHLSALEWWGGRAVTTHARLLLRLERTDSLWVEAVGLWREAVRNFGGEGPAAAAAAAAAESKATTSSSSGSSSSSSSCSGSSSAVTDGDGKASYLSARVWMEWGLVEHFFECPGKGKASFDRAKQAAGLTAGLSGALGLRTKYQQTPYAQMVLLAESAVEPTPEQQTQQRGNDDKEKEEEKEEEEEEEEEGGGDQYGGGALLTGVEMSAASGVIEVATHAADSHLLERTKFTKSTTAEGGAKGLSKEGTSSAETTSWGRSRQAGPLETEGVTGDGEGGDGDETSEASEASITEERRQRLQEAPLQVVDHTIILGLCLDVKNKNPKDGLTNEQMSPYLERVLSQPYSWLVYSTALLQRAWIEFERNHRKERSILQIQALLDQHTTRLTMTQSTSSSVESSAPVQLRLEHLHSIVYPPQWELKRDLAHRYASIGVLISAAELYTELHMWEEVVACYTRTEQLEKAEKLVRSRLAVAETAEMWCALGDIKRDAEAYERAWTLSKGRLSKAKVALARLKFGEGDFAAARGHFEEALAVRPIMPAVWFTLGATCMRLKDYDAALAAFTRSAQLNLDEGAEAWGNMGAIHMQKGDWEAAYTCLSEGLRQARTNWRMWENQVTVLLNTERWGEAVYALQTLLDMAASGKRKGGGGLDIDALRMVTQGVIEEESRRFTAHQQQEQQRQMQQQQQQQGEEASGGIAASPPGGMLLEQLEALLNRAGETSHNSGDLWDIMAVLQGAKAKLRAAAKASRSSAAGPAASSGSGDNTEADAASVDTILDYRLKQMRAVQADNTGWARDPSCVSTVSAIVAKAVECYAQKGSKQSLYAAKMLVKGAIKKVEVGELCVGSEGYVHLQELLESVLQQTAALNT